MATLRRTAGWTCRPVCACGGLRSFLAHAVFSEVTFAVRRSGGRVKYVSGERRKRRKEESDG